MTLEEKVKEASDKWQSRYYESNYTLDDNAKFAAGAKWLLSELKPVMEEMKEALEEIDNPILFMRKRLNEDEELNGPMAVELSKNEVYLKSIARKALSKYNELFKK